MFGTVLVANRGECAVRIIQTGARLGLRMVAVYSAADANALHVRRADVALPIGPAPALASYLNGAAIIAAAERSGAAAIHPGWGFLAENANFAAAVTAAGLTFVGPPAAVIRQLGDKAAARQLARRAGVPIVPGIDDCEQTVPALGAAAATLGFPLFIKAAAGGGGRGLRLVTDAADFPAALESAQREAQAAFGDGRVLLERQIAAARHIEVQILADAAGRVIALGERECSVQRRHQKIIEESPASLTVSQRQALAAAAVAVARAAGYINAGTIEFLLAPDGQFYFLEVNTRLQVEHPVTEAVTGLDIVAEQLRIAAGQPLTVAPPAPHGHAIELRLYAEDAAAGFRPSTGQLRVFAPPSGPGLRHDVGVEPGDVIGPYYDSLLAKLIVTAPDRAAAIRYARRALADYAVAGLTTNLPLLRAVLGWPEFAAGTLTTDWLDRCLPTLAPTLTTPERPLLAAVGWAVSSPPSAAADDPWAIGPWRLAGQGLVLRWRDGERLVSVTADRQAGAGWRVVLPGGERLVRFERTGATGLLVTEGARCWSATVRQHDGWCQAIVDDEAVTLRWAELDETTVDRVPTVAGQTANAIRAPVPGVVAKLCVAVDEVVAAGQPVLIIEAMKMEHTLVAPHAGTVVSLAVQVGASVPAGAILAEVAG